MSEMPSVVSTVLPGGHLPPADRATLHAMLRALEGKRAAITIKPFRAARSSKANRYYWGVVVPTLAEHCGYDVQEMHEVLALRFLRIEDCPVTGMPRRKRTPRTDSKEFGEYVDACIRLAADEGLVIPATHERFTMGGHVTARAVTANQHD